MATSGEPGRFRRILTRVLTTIGAVTLFLLLVMVLVSILALRREGVPREVILELDLEGGLVEHIPEDPFAAVLNRNVLTVRDAVEALKRAETDDRVRALVARVGADGLGMAQVEELRAAVTSFRASGKPAILFAETFGEFGPGQRGYYLATAFEEIHLQPSGDVGLAGLIAETPFLTRALDRFGVEPRMEARYEYKNALNTFTEVEMTESHREATGRVLTSMYENLVDGIARGRGLEPARVRELVDQGPHVGEEALRARLVDRLSYRDEAYDSIRARAGGGEFLYAQQYLGRAGRPHSGGPTIALIYGTGTIQRGESQLDPLAGGAVLGSESVARAFREAIANDQVQAILFRVDSPGGSYVASDAIWRETMRAREAGKPVVVSMGDVAASGGYFVAMGADRIVAHPSTITGSIGVFGGKMVVQELSESVGVTWDDVQVGGNATMWSSVRDYSPAELARLDALLDRIYADFTRKVAAGRGLSPDSAHALARGRIWTGSDALRMGLVDELGGFEVALNAARDLAGIEPDAPVELRVFPRQRTVLEMLLEPRRSSSYPTSLALLLAAGQVVGPLLEQARQLGMVRPRGVLTVPTLPIGW